MIDAKWIGALACPRCRTPFRELPAAGGIACPACAEVFPVESGTPVLMEPDRRDRIARSRTEWVERSAVPPWPHAVVKALRSPDPAHGRAARNLLKRLDARIRPGDRILDLGCGAPGLAAPALRLDLAPAPGVDVAGDGHRLPFADASVNGVIAHHVLEHVEDPPAVVAEIRRILAPGGWVSAVVPFLAPAHRNPIDQVRYPEDGLRHLFRECSIEELDWLLGPTAALAWFLKEYIAVLAPFSNHPRVYASVREGAGWLLAPLTIIDRMLTRKRYAPKIACAFHVLARVAPPPANQG